MAPTRRLLAVLTAVTASAFFALNDAEAAVCTPNKQVNVNMDVSQALTTGTNIKDKAVSFSTVTPAFHFGLRCTGNNKDPIYTGVYVNPRITVAGTDGPWTYYRVDEYFSIGFSWSDCSGTWYIPVRPFNSNCNGRPPFTVEDVLVANMWVNGGDWITRERTTWTVRLRIERAFSGPRPVNLRNIFEYYYGDSPGGNSTFEYISLNGNITVPETCTINAGQIIQVNFGDIGAGRFGAKGQKPEGYTPVTTSAPVTCNDAAAQRNVKVSLAATPSVGLNTAIRTSNPDVGVVVTDVNDRVVQPNVGTLPLRLTSNGAGRNDGTVTMKAFPVSTTGRPPAQGNFSATAAITVTFD